MLSENTQRILDRIEEKYKKPMETLFYVLFANLFICDYISSTMMQYPISYTLGTSLMKVLPEDSASMIYYMILNFRLIIIIPAVFTAFFEAKGLARKLVLSSLLVIGWIYAIHWREQGDLMVFSSLLVVVACTGRDIKKIVKISLISGVAVILLAFVLSQLGIIEDLVWHRGGSAFDRHAFGMNYCTDLSCHTLFLILLYMFYRKGNLRWWEYAVMIGSCVVNILFVDGRIALFCTVAAMAGCLIYQLMRKKKTVIPEWIRTIWVWALVLSFIIAAAILFIWALVYNNDPNIWYNRSVSLGNRLHTNYLLLKNFPFSWLGTWFLQVGWGGISGELDYYFWVDCSYPRLYAMYGIIAFVVYMSILTGVQLRLKKRKAYFAMFLMALVALDCMMEHHMIEITFNTFLVLAFADIDGLTGTIMQKNNPDQGIFESDTE